ncbi:Glycosyltransferase Gtf1 [anaerobic digester metagenome]
MKICIIAPYYLLVKGGVEIVTYYMAKELTFLGHEIHVVSIQEVNKKDEIVLEFLDDGIFNSKFYVHRICLPLRAMVTRYSKIEYILFIIFALTAVRKIRPDIIHAQDFLPAVPAYLSKFFFNIPYTVCVHGEKFSSTGGGILLPLSLKKYWPSLPYIKHSDILFVLKNATKLEVQKYLNKNSVIIPNGVDLDLFMPVRSKFILKSQIPHIICISRLENGKGIECALHAMKLIANRYPGSRLTIIGDGAIREKLEDLTDNMELRHNVEFVGEIPNIDIPKHLSSANIYLLTSFREGFSISLLEAMASGLPIISTPVGIATNICKEWNNGYLVPLNDYNAIYEAVIKVIENPENMSMFSKNSAYNVRKYAWKKIVKQYEKEYYKILLRSFNR